MPPRPANQHHPCLIIQCPNQLAKPSFSRHASAPTRRNPRLDARRNQGARFRAPHECSGVRSKASRISRVGLWSVRQACKSRVSVCEVEHTVKWPTALTFGVSTWLALATSCSARPVTNGPVFGTGVFHPPPKPGDSISHTQMCECKACDPTACCDGPEDDPPAKDCGDSYDFSANPSCGGIAVRSCTSRCTRQIWRVHTGESCSAKRPPTCCKAG